AISQISNSLPRTMRRNAAIIGSISSKSNSKVFGFTVPSLRALLLPCVRVTVFRRGPVMGGSRGQMTENRRQIAHHFRQENPTSFLSVLLCHPSSVIRHLLQQHSSPAPSSAISAFFIQHGGRSSSTTSAIGLNTLK